MRRILPLFLLVACDSAPTVDLGTDADGDRYTSEEDCDDNAATANPGAVEVCDGLDNDCDGEVDEDVVELQYTDADGDTYGDPNSPVETCGESIAGVVHNDADCDDTNAAVNPMGNEDEVICDGLDNDCDGTADGGFRVPADYALPSYAVGAARDGDIVCVSPGTYVDNVDFGGDDVTLLGTGGAEATILQGVPGEGPVVSFDTRESAAAVIQGFTITGGDDPVGAGVYIRGADPTLLDLIITDNACGATDTSCYGVGIYAEESSFTLSNSVVSGNEAYSTNPYYPYDYGAGIALVRGTPTLTDVAISDNTINFPGNAYYGGGYGAGMYVSSSDPDVERVVISGNIIRHNGTTYGQGGGLFVYASRGWFQNVTVVDNASLATYAYGAGIFVDSYNTTTMVNLVSANNVTGGGDTTNAYGSGLFVAYSTLYLENADIVGNLATGSAFSGGGGFYGYYYSNASFDNVSVADNEALSAGVANGGAMAYDTSYPPSAMAFQYSSFSGNGEVPFLACTSPVGTNEVIEGAPKYVDTSGASATTWDLSLGRGSTLVDVGDPDIDDADHSRSDIGSRGGPDGDNW